MNIKKSQILRLNFGEKMAKILSLFLAVIFMFSSTLIAFADENNVRLLLSDDNKIINIDIEDYVAGVLVGEMNENAPEEALKAMAVAARTYTLYMVNKNQNKMYDVSSSSGTHQAYIARSNNNTDEYKVMDRVVKKTKGEYLTYKGEAILAMYHASSLNYTESCVNVFIEDLPYLTSVSTPFENTNNAYFTSLFLNFDEFNSTLSENGFPTFSEENLFLKIETNEIGRCQSLMLQDNTCGIYIQKDKIRNMFNLRSTTFEVSLKDDGVEFRVFGYGHGVGLSQNGAIILAESGETYDEILKKYYLDCEFCKTIHKS